MSDTREKLIEILISHPDIGMTDTVAEMIADYLIDNGVTFATDNFVGDKWAPTAAKDPNVSTKDVPDTDFGKWIPVSERLPEVREDVLCYRCIKNVSLTFDVYTYLGNGQWEDTYGNLDEEIKPISHWMPLPEPPKENER